MTAGLHSLLNAANEPRSTILIVTAHIDQADPMTNHERTRALAACLRRAGFGMMAVTGILATADRLSSVEFLVAHHTGEPATQVLARQVIERFDQRCFVSRRANRTTYLASGPSFNGPLCESPLTPEGLSRCCAFIKGGSTYLIEDAAKLGGFAAALAEQALKLSSTKG